VLRLTSRGQWGQLVGAPIFARAILWLAWKAARRQIGLVHLNIAAYGSFYRKLLLALVCRALRVPYVVHIHSGRFIDFWNAARPRTSGLIALMMRQSSGIIVLGRVYADLFADKLPEVLDKVTVLPNATTTRPERLKTITPDQQVRITFLGRLGKLKGTPELVEALGRLATHAGWTATLAGDGDVADTRARIAALGLADRVAVPGWLGPAGVEDLLAATDVFILPSHSEGLPMSIIEAFAAGIAVIATPVNAVSEVVQHERNGLLVPPGEVDEIAAALRRLIDDADLRRRLGRQARLDHAERYEQSRYIERLVDLWRQAAGDRTPIKPDR
jgi:glycosyltransferase involved in cell wall biosynthesis